MNQWLWQFQHGKDMDGKSMAKTWPEHGKDMARVWQNIAVTWQSHGAGIGFIQSLRHGHVAIPLWGVYF